MLEHLFRHFHTGFLSLPREACSAGSGYCCSSIPTYIVHKQRAPGGLRSCLVVVAPTGSRLVISHL